MKEKIKVWMDEYASWKAKDAADAEAFRIKFLARKGILSALFDEFKHVPVDQKKELGMLLNEFKIFLNQKISDSQQSDGSSEKRKFEDFSRPGLPFQAGAIHPLSFVNRRITEIFANIGYKVAEGPEIEDDWHNFSALNFPPEHPARDMQDTFFINKDFALRTHTSSVQVRVMENEKPPIRKLMPGRVFRNEAISARAHCQFHQVEGLYIDKGVTFSELKQTLLYFSRELFGAQTAIRLRPSYFPFTEPSAEMDVSCPFCSSGCSICKHTGWVEILGCGMVDPQVLTNCNINPEQYSGFAFGLGIERITMMLYGVNDLRLFFENDLRFLSQFKSLQ
jgi:phenylalanyl-tRNA synthetase alpha chain